MATKVYMEALSPTMEEGRLITWLKNEGDQVKEGDVLAEVETDKATMELVARGSGVLRKRIIGEGETQTVGSLIAVIAGADEDISSLVGGVAAQQGPSSGVTTGDIEKADQAAQQGGDVAAAAATLARSEHTEVDSAERGTTDAQPGEAPTPVPGQKAAAAAAGAGQSITAGAGASGSDGGRVKASPLARRLAQEEGLNLAGVQGSGPGGRIVKRDIEAAMQAGTAAQPAQAAAQPEAAPAPVAAPATTTSYREVPVSQMRKAIARGLSQSIGPVPTFYLTVEIDMTEAAKLRARINERFAKEGIKVSPNDLVIKAVSAALRKHPWVNSSWGEQSIRLYDEVHIGVAVAVEEGLIVPVIRDADKKGISEISQEVKELAGRAREKKLKPEEFTGATFSISNLGMFGISEFTAIINPPEAAILAVGAAEDKPVVINGQVEVRSRMRVTLSCDHRVIDGATGAEFLQTLKRNLEDPLMMIA